MKKITTFFDDLLKVFAISSVLLIITGFVDLKIFYSRFGINISHYTSTSEILLSSIDKLAYVLLMMVIQTIIWFYFFDYLFVDAPKKDNSEKKEGTNMEDAPLNRFVRVKFFRFFFIILVIGFFLSITFRSIFPSSIFFRYLADFFIINFWISQCMFIFFLNPTKVLWEIVKKNKEYNSKVVTMMVIFIFVITTSMWWSNNTRFNIIRKYGNIEYLEISLSGGKIIRPTDTLRYVGQTENYVFYWNKITRQADIYPIGEINKLVVKE